MYVRTTQRKRRDGTVVRYVQLARNRWAGGAASAEVLLSLGREDELDLDTLRRLARSIDRYVERATTAPADPSGHPSGHPPAHRRPRGHLDLFVGRERELADLRPALARHRLVTLTGPPGIGKSRLAAEFLDRLPPSSFLGGIWWVRLAPVAGGAAVLSAIGAAIGLDVTGTATGVDKADPTPSAGTTRPGATHTDATHTDATGADATGLAAIAAIAAACAGDPGLLVLDHADRVVADVAALAGELLRSCPRLTVLVTCREPLAVAAEAVVPVGPLEVPAPGLPPEQLRTVESVRLFADRARASAAMPTAAEDDLQAVAGLCRRLDGLPLAVELAARQCVLLPASRLAVRDDLLDLLTPAAAAAGRGERGLRAALHDSYRLLDETAAAVFRRVAVLTGDFDPAAADVVCGDLGLTPARLWDVLRSLTDRSVVAVVDAADPYGPRLRVLGPLAWLGRERLAAAGEEDGVRERLLDWQTALAGQIAGQPYAAEDDELEARARRERHHLRHAVRLAAATGDARLMVLTTGLMKTLRWIGEHHEAGQVAADLERMLPERPGRVGAGTRANAVAALLQVLVDRGEHDAAEPYATELLAHAQATGDRRLTANALRFQAWVHVRRLDLGRAIALQRESVTMLRTAGAATAPLAFALNVLAWWQLRSDDPAAASATIREALAYAGAVSPNLAATLAHTAGTAALLAGDREEAAARFAVPLAMSGVDYMHTPYGLEGLALTAEATGAPERALRLLAAAAASRAEAGYVEADWWSEQCGRAAERARAALAARPAVTADAEGAALPVDAAVAYALTGEWPGSRPPAGDAGLTERERQVAEMVAGGLTNIQIAARLHVSASTVATHLKHIRGKLDATTRAAIAAWYSRVCA